LSTELVHGSSGYNNHGCRCAVCRSAKAEYMRWWRVNKMNDGQRKVDARRDMARRHATRTGFKHGTLDGYTNHSCRCWDCTEAMTAYYRVRNGGSAPKNSAPKYNTVRSSGNGIAGVQAAQKGQA